MSFFSQNIAMDLGTANTLVYTEKRGIVVDEPSVVAVDEKTKKIVGIGAKARELALSSDNITLIRPLLAGVIADFELSRKMISYFVRKARALFFFEDLACHLYSHGNHAG